MVRIALTLLLALCLHGSPEAFPITGSERIPEQELKGHTPGYRYRDGEAGTIFYQYRLGDDAGVWGEWRDLRPVPGVLDDALKEALAAGRAQLRGWDFTTGSWEYYRDGGDGKDLVEDKQEFSSTYRYTLSFDGKAVKTGIEIAFDWDPDLDLTLEELSVLADQWEREVEKWWSRRYKISKDDGDVMFALLFDITLGGYQDGSFDQTVTVLPGPGRASQTEWYITNTPQTRAHEFGHMLGLFDEYWGGMLDPGSLHVDYEHLMGTGGGLQFGHGMEDYYYKAQLDWLALRDDDPTQTYALQRVPAPSSLVLWLAGLAGAALGRRKLLYRRGYRWRATGRDSGQCPGPHGEPRELTTKR